MDEQLHEFNRWFMNSDIAIGHQEACWDAFLAGARSGSIGIQWDMDDPAEATPGDEGGSEDNNPDPFTEH